MKILKSQDFKFKEMRSDGMLVFEKTVPYNELVAVAAAKLVSKEDKTRFYTFNPGPVRLQNMYSKF